MRALALSIIGLRTIFVKPSACSVLAAEAFEILIAP